MMSSNFIYAQEKENELVWDKFKHVFWETLNHNWIDIHDSKRPDFELQIFLSKDESKKHQLYMDEKHEANNIHSIDFTDFVHQIEIDIRDSERKKSVLIFHIADEGLEEKIRLEYDFYVINRLGFNKPIVSYDTAERYIEAENVILNWNEDKTEMKVLIKNTLDYFDLKLITDKAEPKLSLADYKDYEFRYPVVRSMSSDGMPEYYSSSTTDFKVTDNSLYGTWKIANEDNSVFLSSQSFCTKCGGDFWWAKDMDDHILIQVFDLDVDNSLPSTIFKADKATRTLKRQ